MPVPQRISRSNPSIQDARRPGQPHLPKGVGRSSEDKVIALV